MNIALDVVEGILPTLERSARDHVGLSRARHAERAGWVSVERRVRDGWAAHLLERRWCSGAHTATQSPISSLRLA